ncbi:hypothetical protein BFJ63_vAg12087 [Fusarium oxysporum f. sp. narcissi]|uniref:Uncharacterized protein n=1 Tax=Fusarium oxysporum f. sp. narcissi TaxID=451672 RepID=A0A4Q2VD79_FUSOX|nr:hypothetical protein BFJ63_vAg12087 [Fusarium oxysporum f. sp. narcissi]
MAANRKLQVEAEWDVVNCFSQTESIKSTVSRLIADVTARSIVLGFSPIKRGAAEYKPIQRPLYQVEIERGKSKGQYRSSFPPPRLELQRKTSEPGFKQYNKLVVTVPLPHNLPILQLSDPSFDPPRPSRPTLPL